jgi:ubiquinone biosynthesis protein UbiJ
MYPRCDIDKAWGRGETWPVNPELRDALNQVVVDLRGEIRSGDAETRAALNQLAVDLRGETREALDRFAADLLGEIHTSAASLLQQMREMESGMRRHFDVVGESLRSDIRAIAEGMAASREQTDRRIDEHGVRTEGLDSRVLRLEVRVTDLEGDRKPRRPSRRQ